MKARAKEKTAVIYQNDILWMIASGLAGGKGSIPRYSEILKPTKAAKPNENGEDIIKRVRASLQSLRKGGKKNNGNASV